MKKAIVVGSGVIGVSTAYFLNKCGFDVTVLEQNHDVALETSFANGGQLSFSHTTPLANKSIIPLIWRSFLGKDSPVNIDFKSKNYEFYRWLFLFFFNIFHAQRNEQHLKELASCSNRIFEDLITQENIEYTKNNKGIIHLFASNKDSAANSLSREDLIAKDGSFAYSAVPIKNALYFSADKSGDCFEYTKSLSRICMQNGVEFCFSTKVEDIAMHNNAVDSLITNNGRYKAHHYIICSGSALLGLKLPIYPMKGYSVTFAINDSKGIPKTPIIDIKHKMVYSLLGNKLRIAGLADFTAINKEINEKRIDYMLSKAFNLFPYIKNNKLEHKWCGLRPTTPQSSPFIKQIKSNLFINAGHGTLGFTTSAGSAKLLSELVKMDY